MTQPASTLIAAFNADREPERLAMKYASMRADPFRFLRGTCHLFHTRLFESALAPAGPAAWICGDLHLENFGTYLGDNGLTYFDVNDFDETICAPFSWDILRLAVSVLVAAPIIGLPNGSAKASAKALIDTYFAELAIGKPRWLERRTATGPIGDLIEGLKRRDPAKFLAKRTFTKSGKISLLIDGVRMLAIEKSSRAELAVFMTALARQTPNAKPLKLIDAARRIAGTGSLGMARFVLLVESPTNPDDHWLLDLKSAAPSALAPYVTTPQPAWSNEAARVAAIQTLFQANTPSMLSAQSFAGASYTLKQMQPSADRLDLKALATSKEAFGLVIAAMARLTAWGHLRGTGRYGSATADDLIAAAADHKAADPNGPAALLERALALAKINSADWSQYCAAYDQGTFGAPASPDPVE